MPSYSLSLFASSLSISVVVLLLSAFRSKSFSMLPVLRRTNLPSSLLGRSPQQNVRLSFPVAFSTISSGPLPTIGGALHDKDPTAVTSRHANPSQPIVVYASVDPEILAFMELNRNHRKTRILISTKVPSTFHSIRSAIENKFKALASQPYKLRYRLSQDGNSDLLALRGDADVSEAMSAARNLSSSLQLFVQVNPGIFPSTSGQTAGKKDVTSEVYGDTGDATRFVHRPSVDAMRAAHIDPADCESYTMISFYGFHDIAQPSEFAWQLEALWKPFHALGRVYVAREGVNAQMAIPTNALSFFSSATRSLDIFRSLRVNTDHTVTREQFLQTKPFRALHVRAREQILSDGFGDGESGSLDWSRAGQEMHALEWHRRLSAAPDQDTEVRPVVLDCRNSYESEVGLFEGAVPLNTTFFRESWPVLEEVLRDTPKDAPILTYCTGGIRCVKVNAYLQQKMGFTNTHRLQGGIIAYNRELDVLREQRQKEKYATELVDGACGDASAVQSKFRGLNYVFDERIAARITEDVLTACELCAEPCDQFTNCVNHPCNVRFIQCGKCSTRYGGCCSKACQGQHSRLGALPSSTALPRATAAKAPRGSILSRSAQRRAQEGRVDGDVLVPREAQAEEAQIPHVESEIQHAYNSVVASASADPRAHVGMMEALSLYCEAQSEQEPPLLSQLRKETLAHYAGSPGATRMLCDPLQGRLLALLVTVTTAKLVLELGAFTGYSAICLATGLPGDDARSERKVVSCEPDAVARAIAQKYITQGGLQDTIDLRDVKAMTVIEAIRADPAEPVLDLVFLDADKKQYKQYVLALMGAAAGGGRPLLRDGALILVDNTLWKGLVLKVDEDQSDSDEAGRSGGPEQPSRGEQGGVTPRMRALAESLHQFNSFVASEPRLQQLMLPIRDGLSVIRYSGSQSHILNHNPLA